MAMLTDAVYVLLKSDGLQKATGAAFFILFTTSFIFFFLIKIIDRDDNSFDPKIKNTLNLIYMSMVAIIIHYIHNSTAGTIFSFLLTFFLSATLILLILSKRNSEMIVKYKNCKLVTKGILFVTYLTSFIVFNMPKKA